MKYSTRKKLRLTLLFLAIAVIGATNVIDPVPEPYYTTFLFSVRTVLYFLVLVLWSLSVRQRILISKTRNYLIALSCFIILFFFVQAIKYRVVVYHVTLMRYAWYSYYIPLVMICMLFLMACISYKEHRFNEKLLLIPAALLVLLVFTNDIHHLVFIPGPGEPFDGGEGNYTRNVFFYIIYAYYFACVIAGLIFLVRAFRSRKELRRKTIYPFLFLIPWVVVTSLLYYVIMPKNRAPYTEPEIFIFGAIIVIEICIQCGLIPYNENYIGFFKGSRIPSVITDRELQPVYSTNIPLEADEETLNKAVDSPIYDSYSELRVSGMEIHGGYVFWGADESSVRRRNAELEEANDALEKGNDLLKTENDLRAKEIAVTEREKIDRRVNKKMKPYLTQIDALLASAENADCDFYKTIEKISSLNLVVKRGANMLLCADENGIVDGCELLYAVKELATVYDSAKTLCAEVISFSDFKMDSDDMIALLDSVRILLDYFSDSELNEAGIIIRDCSCEILVSDNIELKLPGIPLHCDIVNEDELYRLTVSVKGGEG